MIDLLFYATIVYLIMISTIDILHRRLGNEHVLIVLFISVMFTAQRNNLWSAVVCMAVMGIIGHMLWKKDAIGGADLKILVALVPSLPILGIPNGLAILAFFLIWFAGGTLIYAMLWKYFIKTKEELPLLPIITIAYVITWIFRFS